ncbi:MAG: lysylphosphatidylglycerol synthase domain-containing protein [Candidatus Omnitrophota bacterium]|jgi:uncharacterized membrane protein YbhN (UPF0104 family)
MTAGGIVAVEAFLIFLSLILSTIVISAGLRILLNGDIKLWEAVRLNCVATALNKIFFTGTGYAALSWKLKKDNIPYHKTLSALALIELSISLPWIACGLFFGVRVGWEAPLIFLGAIGLIAVFLAVRKNKIKDFLGKIFGYLKDIAPNIMGFIPVISLNFLLGWGYYFLLFKTFGLSISIFDVLEVVSVAFSAGYLSPIPSGLGIKDSGIIYMLMKHGVPFKNALIIAMADRGIVTGLYLILGFLFGADIIRQEIKSKFKRRVREK